MTVDVDRLQALLDAATPGGWEWHDHHGEMWIRDQDSADMYGNSLLGHGTMHGEADAALVVAAVNALPALLAVVAERDKLHRDGAAMVGDHVELQNLFETMRKERDKLAATVARVESKLDRLGEVSEVSGSPYDQGHTAGVHLAATIIRAMLDGQS